jgi:hypothetical protein
LEYFLRPCLLLGPLFALRSHCTVKWPELCYKNIPKIYQHNQKVQNLVYFGMFWNIFDYVGIFLEYYGILWNIMEYYGILWNIMEYYGILWNIMEYYGILWNTLDYEL